jgi:FixJ family two-component response regulator
MSDATPIVFIVDQSASMRASIGDVICRAGLRSEGFGTAEEFLKRSRPHAPCCLVLDVGLPDLSGLELQARLAADRAEMPLIFSTGCQDVATVVRAMKAGAFEFLPKPADPEALLMVVSNAIERSRLALARQARVETLRERLGSLTQREREVMSLVVSGRLNKQVGGELGISEITVKAHRGRVMRKMRAESLPHLVNMASTLRLTSVVQP